MNRLSLVLAVVLVMAIVCQPSGLRAQDPNDPGEPDTVYLTPGSMHSPSGDTLYIWPAVFPQDVTIKINAWNDNVIDAFCLVFIDSCNGPPAYADLDLEKNNYVPSPKCFRGSRVEHFDAKIFNVQSFPPIFRLGGSCPYADPLPPGDGLVATLIFTVSDTGRICVDTCFYAPSLTTYFATPIAQKYAPVFEKTTFVITDCQYLCGDPNYDGETNLADVVHLINYVLKSGPAPCVVKSGDVNCDDATDIVDITYFINYLFRDGPAPGYCP
jgi:hypothetical protein